MKQTKLSELSIIPEDYDPTIYENIDWSTLHSEMSDIERRFIYGLIRYYEPQHMLEIGVYGGGGTVNILNAVSDRTDHVKVISIDHAEVGHYGYTDSCPDSLPIGIDVTKAFPHITGDRYRLITGKDPSEVMDEVGKTGIDFAIIDTDHSHPVESLNFLSIFPFMNEGGIVVLHDISLFLSRSLSGGDLATRILLCSLVAEKITPKRNSGLPNVAAIQVTADTRKYIQNVFDALLIPWGIIPVENDMRNIRELLVNHFSQHQVDAFDQAVAENKKLFVSGHHGFAIAAYIAKSMIKMKADSEGIVTFYGAGTLTAKFLDSVSVFKLSLDIRIWDERAIEIKKIAGYKVNLPDFDSAGEGQSVIIMIADAHIANLVRVKLEALGYKVFHEIGEYVQMNEIEI